MVFEFLTVLVVSAWLLLRRHEPSALARAFEKKLPPYAFGIAAAALPIAFWIQVRLATIEAAHDALGDDWAAGLPIKIAFNFDAWRLAGWLTVPFATFVCVATASAALLVLCALPARSRSSRAALICCATVLAFLAIFAPVLTSSDVYMYVFAGGVGHAIYAPPPDLFGPANVLMDRHIALRGALYGPAWVAIDGFIVSLGHTAAEKIVALRAFNALLVVGCACALRQAGAPRRAQLAFILNPMVWFYTVLNAHNDVIAIFPCLVAIAVVRQYRLAAILLVAFAGCIKLPFLVLGLLVFARPRDRSKGVASAIAAIGLCLAASWAFAGAPYLLGIFGFVHAKSASGNALLHVFGACATIVALACIAYAFATGRFLQGAAFTMANLSPFVFPGYVLWALPYAVLAERGLTSTLIAMPLAALLVDDTYALKTLAAVAFVLVTLLCAFDALRVPRVRPLLS